MSGLRIEIGVAAAGIDRAVPDANIRQTGGAVVAHRNIAGDVSHVVVDTAVPTERELRIQISETCRRVADVGGQWSERHAVERTRLTIQLKLSVVNGPPRSLTNINGDLGASR